MKAYLDMIKETQLCGTRKENRTGVDTLRFNTVEPFAPTLQRFFEIRRGRRRR